MRTHKTYQPQRTAAPERGAASRTRPGRAGLWHAEPGEVNRRDSDPQGEAEDPPQTGSVDCRVPGNRQTRPEPPAVQERSLCFLPLPGRSAFSAEKGFGGINNRLVLLHN